MKLSRAAFGSLLFSFFFPLAAHAQNGFNLRQNTPTPSLSGGYISVERPVILDSFHFESVMTFEHVNRPLVVTFDDGDTAVVGGQTIADLHGAIGLFDIIEIGLGIPVFLIQPSPSLAGSVVYPEPVTDSMGGSGLGDIRVHLRGLFLSLPNLSLGGSLQILLPTGSEEDFQGGGFALEPRLSAEYSLANELRFGANLGYRMQENDVSGGFESTDLVTWGAATTLPLGPVEGIAELNGRANIGADYFGVEESPAELALGARRWISDELVIQGSIGRGITGGVGAPAARIMVNIGYQSSPDPDRDQDGLLNADDECPDVAEDYDDFEDSDGCPELDNDEDGVLDDADLCSDALEDYDDFEDSDGCPELDNDEDGILDEFDACPLEPEDLDSFEDSDGCPETDNDGDSVLDYDDFCPNLAEDLDGFEDLDGCPEMDNDGDGVLDDNDPCRDEAEVINGVDDNDGCPDESAIVFDFESNVINYDQPITFVERRATLMPESSEVLDLIAAAMLGHFEIQIDIEVRTNERSQPEENLPLSQERAAAVLDYLTNAGIAAGRINSQGLGLFDPPVSETTTTVIFTLR